MLSPDAVSAFAHGCSAARRKLGVRAVMDSWYKMTGIDGVDGRAVEGAFAELWIARQMPNDAAMFAVRDHRARTNDFYFSPGAARVAGDLIVRYAGVECPRPEIAGLALVVGDQGAVDFS